MCAKWKLSNRLSLSLGCCVDWGINNVVRNENQPLLSYNPFGKPVNNSELVSKYPNGGIEQKAFTEKVFPMLAIAKLRISYGFLNKQ
jgi:hypothetical protein